MRTFGRVSNVVDTNVRAEEGEADAFVDLISVGDTYPLLGQVDSPRAARRRERLRFPRSERDGVFGALVDPLMLDQLGIRVGDSFALGGTPFEARGALTGLPDAAVRGFRLGLPAVITTDALASPLRPHLAAPGPRHLVPLQARARGARSRRGQGGARHRARRCRLDRALGPRRPRRHGALLRPVHALPGDRRPGLAADRRRQRLDRHVGLYRRARQRHRHPAQHGRRPVAHLRAFLRPGGDAGRHRRRHRPRSSAPASRCWRCRRGPRPSASTSRRRSTSSRCWSRRASASSPPSPSPTCRCSRRRASARCCCSAPRGSPRRRSTGARCSALQDRAAGPLRRRLLLAGRHHDRRCDAGGGLRGGQRRAVVLFRVAIWLAIQALTHLPEPKNRVLRHALRDISGSGSNAPSVVISVGLALAMLVVVLVLQVNLRNEYLGASVFDAPTLVASDLFDDEVELLQAMKDEGSDVTAFTATPMLRGALSGDQRHPGGQPPQRAAPRPRSCSPAKCRSPIASNCRRPPSSSRASGGRPTMPARRWCRCTRACAPASASRSATS